MTTNEMILLCPSLQGVRRCIPLCLMSCFATFAAFWKIGSPPSNGLKHAVCIFHCGQPVYEDPPPPPDASQATPPPPLMPAEQRPSACWH